MVGPSKCGERRSGPRSDKAIDPARVETPDREQAPSPIGYRRCGCAQILAWCRHRARRASPASASPIATAPCDRWKPEMAFRVRGPDFPSTGPGLHPRVFEKRLDNSKIRCCSKGCRGGRRAHALVVRRRGQKLQQSGMQILVSCSCRKPVLCRECRDRCPGALADDPIDLAGIEASRGRSAATARRARGDPTILPWKGSVGGGQFLVVAIFGEIRSVVAACERRPVAALERRVQAACPHEAHHSQDPARSLCAASEPPCPRRRGTRPTRR